MHSPQTRRPYSTPSWASLTETTFGGWDLQEAEEQAREKLAEEFKKLTQNLHHLLSTKKQPGVLKGVDGEVGQRTIGTLWKPPIVADEEAPPLPVGRCRRSTGCLSSSTSSSA